MVVNYSKWDALEVSDDSDIEVHPNVDKRSFIRAKQNQIHQERAQRKHEITTLKYERIINDALLTRIDALLNALKSHASDVSNEGDPDMIIFQSIMESAGDSAMDNPPPRPEGVHAQIEEQPTYSKMMASLVDQVKKAVEAANPADKLQGYIKEITSHKDKVMELQQQLLERLAQLEKEEGAKITSENIRTGFDSSHVAKSTAPTTPASTASKSTPELLNPSRAAPGASLMRNDSADSGAEADIEDAATPSHSDTERIRPSALGKQFGKLAPRDYSASLDFISQHPSVLAERETDGLLIQAWEAETAGKHEMARQLVHQALLIKYCISLSGGGGGGAGGGRNGVGLFFKRVTTPGHEARTLFLDDVNETYQRLKERSAAIAAEDAAGEGAGGDGGEVEQIQLHAVNPDQTILIQTPSASATDPQEVAARKAFEAFPPGLQRALETGELEQVNKVLGKMSVSEAEEVVGQLGDHGMLSMEEGIIDATTDEGRLQMEEIEKTGRFPGREIEEINDDDDEAALAQIGVAEGDGQQQQQQRNGTETRGGSGGGAGAGGPTVEELD